MTINWNSRTVKDNVSVLLQLKLKYTPEEFGYRGSRGCFNSNLETVFVRLFLNTHAKVIKTNNEGKETNGRYPHPRNANEVINSRRRSPRNPPAQHLRKKRATEARKRPSEDGSARQRALCTSDFHAPRPSYSGAVHLLLVLFVRLCELLPSKHDYAAI